MDKGQGVFIGMLGEAQLRCVPAPETADIPVSTADPDSAAAALLI